MTEHLAEARCQSAAFNQIVAAMGKYHKKMKNGQKFTAIIKQITYVIVGYVRFLLVVVL